MHLLQLAAPVHVQLVRGSPVTQPLLMAVHARAQMLVFHKQTLVIFALLALVKLHTLLLQVSDPQLGGLMGH